MGILRRLVALLALAALVGAQAGVAPASAAGIVRNPGDPFYEARLRATQGGRVWTGRIDISFTNLEAAPLGTIYLRLWSNGVYGCGAGAIQIWDLTGGNMGAPALDCTEIPVTLTKALAQGERATLSMQLRITLPWLKDRFGYSGGLALVGTALPTLEVHDDQGWHHDPFEDLGESFYSITGRYRVTLEGPPDLDTPTTGTLVGSPVPLPGGLVARTYAADGVRDFAWAAGRLEQVSGGTAPRVVVSYRAGAVTKTQAEEDAGGGPHEREQLLRSRSGPIPTQNSTWSWSPSPTSAWSTPPSSSPRWTSGPWPTRSPTSGGTAWWATISTPRPGSMSHWPPGPGTCPGEPGWGALRTISRAAPGSPATCATGGITPPSTTDVVYDAGGCMLANLAQKFGTTRFLGILRGLRRRPLAGGGPHRGLHRGHRGGGRSSTACPSTPTSTGRPGGWTRPEARRLSRLRRLPAGSRR